MVYYYQGDNMNIVGIVAEYNPFHNGHLYHLNKAKELANADYSIAIMSSNFVQRGEPSIFSKWQRAEMAVNNGVDLVLELPVLFSSRSAYHFAFGSIFSLEKSNVITHLAFGSEDPDLSELNKIASLLAKENPTFKNLLKKHLKQGLSYPKAREKALNEYFPEMSVDLNQSNVILAINYLRVLDELNSPIIPVPIKRIGAYHGLSPVNNIAGATLIRNLMKNKDSTYESFLTDNTIKVIEKHLKNGFEPVFLDDFNTQIMYQLRKIKKEDLINFPGVKEGLENKLINSLCEGNYLDEIVSLVKSKRFTETRIKRILIEILLELNNQFDNSTPEYLRVLAFNEKGRDILNKINQKSSLPVITKFADFYNKSDLRSKKLLDLEIISTNIYTQIQKDIKYNSYNQEFTMSPLYLS
jgi:cytidyltransferase-like protein